MTPRQHEISDSASFLRTQDDIGTFPRANNVLGSESLFYDGSTTLSRTKHADGT